MQSPRCWWKMIVGVRLSGEDKDYTENDLNQTLEICSALDSEPI